MKLWATKILNMLYKSTSQHNFFFIIKFGDRALCKQIVLPIEILRQIIYNFFCLSSKKSLSYVFVNIYFLNFM